MNDSSLLSALRGKKKCVSFLVLDIESKDGSSREWAGFTRPFMVGVYDGKTYTEFRDNHPTRGRWDHRYFFPDGCVAQAMRYILQKRYAGWRIYAHNAGRFDYLHILPWLMFEGRHLGFQFSIIPIASAIQALDVTCGNGRNRWRFLDSARLMPMSLSKACKAFGLKGKKEHCLDTHEYSPKWSGYLRQDCEELYLVLERFHNYIENVLGGEVKMTTPSTAVNLFRRRYLTRSIPRSISTHDFVREGYCGGRVEVHRHSGENLYYYDINSSYPRAMLEPMPVGEGQWWEGEPPRWMQKWIGFVNCEVLVPEDIVVPPLPVRHSLNAEEIAHTKGKLLFPVGKLRGTWEWGELQKAIEMGVEVVNWHTSVWYEPGPLFEEFVRDIYKYRDKSRPDYDEGLALIAKLILNASYGKFGMKTERRQIYRFDDPDMPQDAIPAGSDPDCPIYYATKIVDAPYIMPQISARVTALARVRLLDAMLSAIERGGRVYYVDTDSVITDVELPTSTELGALKDEYPEWSGHLRGKFLGPKLYMLTANNGEFENVKAKGFESRTVKLLERLERGEVIFQKRLEKVGSMAQRGFMSGPKMLTVPRSLHLDRGKRRKLPNGNTEPWKLEMWQ